MHRIIVTARNSNFPLLSDGVHSKAHPPVSVPQRPPRPRIASAAGAVPPYLEIATTILGMTVFSLVALFFLVLA